MQDIDQTAPTHSAQPPETDQLEDTEDLPEKKGAAGKIALVILGTILLLIVWLTLADKLAPYSSKGFVSANTTLISPRASGQVKNVLVKDNQYIQEGGILFTLDPEPFDLAVLQAKANLAQAKQSVEINRAALSAAEARVQSADSVLERTSNDAQRTRALFKRGVATKARIDAADSAHVAAKAATRVARSDLERARLSVGGEHNPQLDVAHAQLKLVELNRTFATVVAPTSGYVTNLRLTPGQYVPIGSYAMTFIASDELWISTDLRENQLINVDAGDTVSLMFDARAGELFEGVVESVAWGIDTGRTAANGLTQNNPSTRWFEPARTIPVHITLQGRDWPENVRVGSMVTTVVFTEGEDGLIPWIGKTLHRLQSYISYIY